MGRHAVALVALLETACRNAAALAVTAQEAFNAHPDAAVIGSFPGVGTLTGARLLAEIGDDHRRFADPRGLKAYAGSAPITRASGRSRSVTTRRIKNQRLAAAGYAWAFSALTASPAHAATTTDAAIGPIAKPRQVMLVPELPKTRSGKIMRRLLKDIAEPRELGDVTTLNDSAVMDVIGEKMPSAAAQED